MATFENDWTRETEKLTKQRDVLLKACQLANTDLTALCAQRGIPLDNRTILALRRAIAEVEGAA